MDPPIVSREAEYIAPNNIYCLVNFHENRPEIYYGGSKDSTWIAIYSILSSGWSHLTNIKIKHKVAMIGSRGIPHSGGVEKVLEAVCPRLVEAGCHVRVYSSKTHRVGNEFWRGVELNQLPSLNHAYFDTILRSTLATAKEVLLDSRIIHFHGSGSAPLGLIARIFGRKVVVTIHGRDWERSKWNGFGRYYLQFGEWMACRFAHRVVVVSSELQYYVKQRYGVYGVLIGNGAEKRTTRPLSSSQFQGLTPYKYILFVARLVPDKRADLLIRAFQSLTDRRGRKLVLAGPSWFSEDYVVSLRTLANDDPDIIFVGEVGDYEIEQLYPNCETYVLPSEVEGMSLSLLDAMAFGACVIVSDIPGNAAVVAEAGLKFRSGSVEELTDCLTTVINREDFANELRDRARARVTEDFDWDVISGKWMGVYNELLGEV